MSGPVRSRIPGRLIAALAAFLLAVALPGAASGRAAAPAAQPPGGIGSRPQVGEAAAGSSHTVTLLTGDVVVVHSTPDGEQSAWIAEPAEAAPAGPPAQIYRQDGQTHVVPAEAAPYLASGVLDPNLFNVSLLVQQGYDDASRDDLPLLVGSSQSASSDRLPATPAGADRVRTLRSIGAISVTADKGRIRAVWESLRGPRPAPVDAQDASLAAAGKVWLNGRVQATLEDSVPQIGAPKAWAQGYDGSGVRVAVLDTGYDPTHPDLAGKVVDAQNFSDTVDPPGEVAVDGHGHGTHVAATVAGTGAASDGARKGVAPGADLLVGKVLDDSGSGYQDQIIAGMQWAVREDADVVNLSLGTPYATDGTDPMSQAVNELASTSDTLFVVAAGNLGPSEQTIAAPGAADLALTVGAVTKSDTSTDFSSRGPRLGDGAIKPEIVAPGAGIIAARASGTSLGNLVDANYTALSGTSMATPHVAGAAAILAQRFADWDPDRLKSRLVATSRALPDEPVTFQGAGRVDVAAAVRDTAEVSPSVLSWGQVAQSDEPVSRTLTYHNPTDRPMRLRLSSDVTGTGSDPNEKPDLRIGRTVLAVPPQGSARTTVTLDPGSTSPGGYAGRIVAQETGSSREVHTVLSVTVNGPVRTVTVHAVDREGDPGSGFVDLWSAETGRIDRVWMRDGVATAQVSEGLYTVMTTIERMGEDSWWALEQTVVGDPDLRVRGDVTLRYDARDGEQVTVDTPREADMDSYDLLWSRTVGDRSFMTFAAQGIPGQRVYVIPSPKAVKGSFTFAAEWQLVEPMLRADVTGADGFRVTPNPQFASLRDPFVGEETLPVVDVGSGTQEEFAAVDAAGKVALVRRNDDIGLWAQVQSARDAGVALLLASNNVEGVWPTSVWGQNLPTYLLDRSAGDRLRGALADDPGLTLHLRGLRDSSYTYELTFSGDRLPRDPAYRVGPADLATVVSDYRQPSERAGRHEMWIPVFDTLGVGNGLSIGRNGPVERTEYVSTDKVRWQRFGQPHGEFPSLYWTLSGLEQYEAGQQYHQVWWGPLVHPAVPPLTGAEESGLPVARFRDAIRINIPHYFYGGSLYGTIFEQAGDRSELTLRRDGEVVGKSSWPRVQFSVPASEAEYELSLDVTSGPGNFSDTAVHTATTWTFRSARSDETRTVLPLVQVGYGLETGQYNEVAAGSPYPLTIEPGYQPGASGPGGFTVEVEVSYDDGDTWVGAPVEPVGGSFRATIPAASGSGFASVRVVATDAAGNSLDQQIDRGWKVSAD